MKTFALRVDLESQKGISKGSPKLLKLLDEFGFKVSFYVTMGGEPNIFEILEYRGKLKSAGERKIKIWTLREKIRMVLSPIDFVTKNKNILKNALEKGHEIGIHGWKHRTWSRGLEKLNIEKQINDSIKKYTKLFKKKPYSFTAPTFRTNEKVISILDRNGIKVISDYPGEKPFKIRGTNVINVPITIKGKNNTPIIEYLVSQGMNDEEILDYLKKHISEKDYSVLYIHGLFECIQKTDLLRKLFSYLKEEKIKVKTNQEISKRKKY